MEIRKGSLIVILVLLGLLVGCAGVPVREAVKVDLSVPVGKIEGNQFVGFRYPFKVSAPPGWKISTEYQKFMLDLGYEKEGLEESQVFVYNPATESNLQIDFTSAGRYNTFDQKKIEWLTTAATGSFKEELEKELKSNPERFTPHGIYPGGEGGQLLRASSNQAYVEFGGYDL